MICQIGIGPVYIRIVEACFGHRAFEAIGNGQTGHTAKIFKCAYMTHCPAFQPLAFLSFGIEIMACSPCHDKQFYRRVYARYAVANMRSFPGIINKQLLSANVALAHGNRQWFTPLFVHCTKTAVTIAVGLILFIFFP